jgi:hypothetical protein
MNNRLTLKNRRAGAVAGVTSLGILQWFAIIFTAAIIGTGIGVAVYYTTNPTSNKQNILNSSSSSSSGSISSSSSTGGFYPYSFCTSNPAVCGTNGTCTDSIFPPYYNCSCGYGFSGVNCTQNICSLNPAICQNQGICQPLSFGSGYQCNCAFGYFGQNCTNTACTINPTICSNSQCVYSSSPPGYQCVCNPGFQKPLNSSNANNCSLQFNLYLGYGKNSDCTIGLFNYSASLLLNYVPSQGDLTFPYQLALDTQRNVFYSNGFQVVKLVPTFASSTVIYSVTAFGTSIIAGVALDSVNNVLITIYLSDNSAQSQAILLTQSGNTVLCNFGSDPTFNTFYIVLLAYIIPNNTNYYFAGYSHSVDQTHNIGYLFLTNSSGIVTTIANVTGAQFYSLAFDGTYFYTSDYNSPTIYRSGIVPGTNVISFTVNLALSQWGGLSYDPFQRLFYCGSNLNGNVYSISLPSGNATLFVSNQLNAQSTLVKYF